MNPKGILVLKRAKGVPAGSGMPLGRAQGDLLGLDPPDALGVLGDGPVRGEHAHAGHVEDGPAAPIVVVAPILVDAFLSPEEGAEVGEDHEFVPADQAVQDRLEEL